jgi:hypothetical protein
LADLAVDVVVVVVAVAVGKKLLRNVEVEEGNHPVLVLEVGKGVD